MTAFEQTPVPQQKWKGWGSFIGMYAGEHTAGTEFVIGPLFVARVWMKKVAAKNESD